MFDRVKPKRDKSPNDWTKWLKIGFDGFFRFFPLLFTDRKWSFSNNYHQPSQHGETSHPSSVGLGRARVRAFTKETKRPRPTGPGFWPRLAGQDILVKALD
jgi:hypothetical protein